MTNDRSQIEEIREKIDIVNLVGKYVEIRPAGKNFVGLCPFHTEKTPSFHISPDTQRYKCFGCGQSGDIFNFIQEIENLDFPETLEKLAKEAGVELKKIKKNPHIEKLELLNRKATEYYFRSLKKNDNIVAFKYLTGERRYTEDSIKNFALGYAPGNGGLITFLKKSGSFSEQDLLSSGLFSRKGLALREKFFKRVMFPIRNSRGKFIGFSGRVLPGNDFGPKYMNTPETPIFHKKENLFGLYESRQAIRKQDLAIVCEGQTDVISAFQNGISNIVSPLGTALTTEQLEKLSRFTKNVLFFFDSDEAGQKAMVRAFKMASELNLHPFATSPSPYKDLDEMINKDLKELKLRIKKKRDAFSFLLFAFIENKDLANYEDFNKTQKFINDLLSSVVDQTAFSFYKKKAEKIVGVLDKDITRKKLQKTPPIKDSSQCASHEKQIPKNESSYLQLLLLLDEIAIPKDHDTAIFTAREILEILRYIEQNPKKSRQEIFKQTKKSLVEDLIFASSKIIDLDQESIKRDLEDIYLKIQKLFIEKKKKRLGVKIAIAEEKGDLEKSKLLLAEYQDLVNQ